MGRAPCCGDHEGLKRGPWTAEEDQKLIHYVQSHGPGNWRTLPKLAGLSRCGKSCRLRWANYLRPDIKRGTFSMQEELTIIRLHAVIGNKWSAITSHLPGRTDNEIKNHWNTKLKKRLLLLGIDPVTHMSLPTPNTLSYFMTLSSTAIAARLNSALVEAQLGRLARDPQLNINSSVSAISTEQQYLWQLSQSLKSLGKLQNPAWAHPSRSLSSFSRDQALQPDVLRWLHSNSQNQIINQGFVSGQKDDSTEHNMFSKKSLQFSDLKNISEAKNLPISTDHGSQYRITATSWIEDQPSSFDTEITDWNSRPILMTSSNPDQNKHLYYYSDEKSSATTSTNSYEVGSEIVENTIHDCHQDDTSLPSARTVLQGDESRYWVELLNSIEDAILI